MPYIKGGMLLYESENTIVVCTGMNGGSRNPKTGKMAQTFILKRYVRPTIETKGAGCDGCPVHESCYVLWHYTPLAVYKAYKNDRYDRYTGSWEDMAKFSETHLRVGAAGEPTKMPAYRWLEILEYVKSWTGYTHKWEVGNNQPFRVFCMASVHTVDDMERANEMGWRTYRVGGGPITEDEIMCPYYTNGTQCVSCGLCKGSSIKAKNIYAPAHGARKNKIK